MKAFRVCASVQNQATVRRVSGAYDNSRPAKYLFLPVFSIASSRCTDPP
jgi:hypothetical protein